MRRAAATVPTSREIALALGFTSVQAAQSVVPMGVDVQRVISAVGRRCPAPGRFLFVGRLEEKKGLDVLLAALSDLSEATLVVIGEGRDAERLRGLAGTLGISDRVTWLGQQGWERVMAELRRAHALVIPSKVASNGDSETTPLVMSEAMAASTPVIASRLGGLAEQIVDGRTGLLCEPGSAEGLADVLKLAMRDPDLLTGCASRARSGMIGALDLQTTSARYRAIYEHAIHGEVVDASTYP
jgi:glycosyltransferase involved in cell wall biosynthesis